MDGAEPCLKVENCAAFEFYFSLAAVDEQLSDLATYPRSTKPSIRTVAAIQTHNVRPTKLTLQRQRQTASRFCKIQAFQEEAWSIPWSGIQIKDGTKYFALPRCPSRSQIPKLPISPSYRASWWVDKYLDDGVTSQAARRGDGSISRPCNEAS